MSAAINFQLTGIKIGALIKISSFKCAGTHAKPTDETGILNSIEKDQGIKNDLVRVTIKQQGKNKVNMLTFYTKNIAEITIL